MSKIFIFMLKKACKSEIFMTKDMLVLLILYSVTLLWEQETLVPILITTKIPYVQLPFLAHPRKHWQGDIVILFYGLLRRSLLQLLLQRLQRSLWPIDIIFNAKNWILINYSDSLNDIIKLQWIIFISDFLVE